MIKSHANAQPEKTKNPHIGGFIKCLELKMWSLPHPALISGTLNGLALEGENLFSQNFLNEI
ncbi:hypothetical protein GCM10011328_18430 [Hafnia psychrotolerans]|uniref:Uncharacterized protein n=1 Tax=Hafnia psychrotolerans TaxID=1477018 RepID=A0ABQ1GH27_9GAMM|nr:hypothetical protein GCM10011328_18430 [Hafnia psychrotolerans]